MLGSVPNLDALKLVDDLAGSTMRWSFIRLLPEDQPKSLRERYNSAVLLCYALVSVIVSTVCVYELTEDVAFTAFTSGSGVNMVFKVLSFISFPAGWEAMLTQACLQLSSPDVAFVRRSFKLNPVVGVWGPGLREPAQRSQTAQLLMNTYFFFWWVPLYLAFQPDWKQKLPFAAAMLVVCASVNSTGATFQIIITCGLYQPHARAVAANLRALASQLKSNGEAQRLRKAAIAKDRSEAATYLDALTNDYVFVFEGAENLSKIYANYFTLAEFTIPLTIALDIAAIYLLATTDGGGSGEFVLLIAAVLTLPVFFGVAVEVFLVGASVTSAGDDVASALRDLSLKLPSGASDHVTGVLARLQAHVQQRPPAFRPHGFTISTGAAVAVVDIVAMCFLVAFIESLI